MLEFIKSAAINLVEADIIGSGGRGLGSAEGFDLLKELAEVIGGGEAPPCRVAPGWITVDQQVGQTGKTVKPKIYIACGISGAIQHLAGMRTSDCIVSTKTRMPHIQSGTWYHGDYKQFAKAYREIQRQTG